ncbi:MAG: glucose-1-phosphate cytidylyltransferase [Hyphomonadaceae bacterium]
MKAVIFAGGFGTRLAEETAIRPKPMVEVGARPILWHIMKICAHHGINDFVVLGGYKVEFIRNWLLNYRQSLSDFTIDLHSGHVEFLSNGVEPWRITVLDTGLETMTGGRLKRARQVIGQDSFLLTYGDGVSDVDLTDLIAFHKRHGKMATVTAVAPAGRFGILGLSEDSDTVSSFREKDRRDTGLINGGFFVCEAGVFDLIDGDATVWEQEPMDRLVQQGELAAYRHQGFWQAMDNVHDRTVLERMWSAGKAPWKVWAD